MAPPRKTFSVGFPVYSVAFTPKKPRVVVGGGGGATKAGVKNAMMLYDINPLTLELTPVAEHKFGTDEDGCMSVAVHPKEKVFVAGVNSPLETVKAGNNKNCRIFHFKSEQPRFVERAAHKTLDSKDSFFHQKVAKFDPTGTILITGTTDGKLGIWKWPDFKPLHPGIDHGGEVVDADFDSAGKNIVSISPDKCYVTDATTGRTVWSIEKPVMHKTTPGGFRACRYGKGTSAEFLFLIVNTKDRKNAYICKWQISNWKLYRQRKIASKPVSAFALSNSGECAAYGLADFSVNILSTKNLQTFFRISSAHSFAITALEFSPNSQLLVSGSADTTLNITVVPPPPAGMPLVPVALLVLFFIVLFTYMAMLQEEQEL
ncbi:quinon protein alcohol dehydrogenase-like superfamily [Phlyctochytrium arcticum]|nr:quinon protein alcohol dehydrogenase-like superfamily [Phlyctochytrium arcticum]